MHSSTIRICLVYLLLGLSIATCACAGRGNEAAASPAAETLEADSSAAHATLTAVQNSSAAPPAIAQAAADQAGTPQPAEPAADGEELLPDTLVDDSPADDAAGSDTLQDESQPEKPPFDLFVDALKNGNPDQIVGVYVENVLALRVMQQPAGEFDFVSPTKGIATQFLLAYEVNGNIGLLAHNYLSGGLFFDLRPGQVVELIYGDGWIDEYEIGTIHEYQVISPLSVSSDFIDLETGERINVATLFDRVYGGEHHLVFQTCIDRDGNDSWGRLFVIAPPY